MCHVDSCFLKLNRETLKAWARSPSAAAGRRRGPSAVLFVSTGAVGRSTARSVDPAANDVLLQLARSRDLLRIRCVRAAQVKVVGTTLHPLDKRVALGSVSGLVVMVTVVASEASEAAEAVAWRVVGLHSRSLTHDVCVRRIGLERRRVLVETLCGERWWVTTEKG